MTEPVKRKLIEAAVPLEAIDVASAPSPAPGRDGAGRDPEATRETPLPNERIDRFTWYPGDIEIVSTGDWTITYRISDGTALVQDLSGLVQHLMQQLAFDGDLASALDTFYASDVFRFAPKPLVGDILATTGVVGVPPLSRNREQKPRQGDGTARHGYGVEVFERDQFRCRYCDLDMRSTYQNWLQLSVDHVIPHQMAKLDYPADLVEDRANLVTCCRSCNDFGNRFVVTESRPDQRRSLLRPPRPRVRRTPREN